VPATAWLNRTWTNARADAEQAFRAAGTGPEGQVTELAGHWVQEAAAVTAGVEAALDSYREAIDILHRRGHDSLGLLATAADPDTAAPQVPQLLDTTQAVTARSGQLPDGAVPDNDPSDAGEVARRRETLDAALDTLESFLSRGQQWLTELASVADHARTYSSALQTEVAQMAHTAQRLGVPRNGRVDRMVVDELNQRIGAVTAHADSAATRSASVTAARTRLQQLRDQTRIDRAGAERILDPLTDTGFIDALRTLQTSTADEQGVAVHRQLVAALTTATTAAATASTARDDAAAASVAADHAWDTAARDGGPPSAPLRDAVDTVQRARDAVITATPADRPEADERWRSALDALTQSLTLPAGPAGMSTTDPDPLRQAAHDLLRTAQSYVDAHRAQVTARDAVDAADRDLAADPREVAWREVRRRAGEVGAALATPPAVGDPSPSAAPAIPLTLSRHLRGQPPGTAHLSGMAAVRRAVDLVLSDRLPEAVELARSVRVPPPDRVSGVELIGRISAQHPDLAAELRQVAEIIVACRS
jgi:hypothetical protein